MTFNDLTSEGNLRSLGVARRSSVTHVRSLKVIQIRKTKTTQVAKLCKDICRCWFALIQLAFPPITIYTSSHYTLMAMYYIQLHQYVTRYHVPGYIVRDCLRDDCYIYIWDITWCVV